MMPGMMMIMNVLTVGIVWFGAKKIDAGSMQVGAMTAFITYAMMIVMSFLMLTMMSIMLPRAAVAADRIDEVIQTESSIVDIDEPETMRRVVTAISGAVSLPLQIDSSSPKAIEAGLRAAPGKCMVNSVNASRTSLEAVLPIAKKYGAAVVGLALGENGLPTTCEARMGFARTILNLSLIHI